EPLAQLGNLNRLSDAEVREAARVIMDQRDTRIGKLPAQFRRIQRETSPSRTTKLILDGVPVFNEESGSGTVEEKLVPTPPAEDE
ncbi:MAG TPA: hypothetical protein DCY03_27230, partial [Planctomycetaceae bacterium]|nr:hypothetical protein [Planctomycetaceae bacterium]